MSVITRSAASRAYTYLLSLFNSRKFLNPLSPIAFQTFGSVQPESSSRAYVLIYGAGNRAGSTYAHYLAEKGFNLILIDRDMTPLTDIEIALKDKFGKRASSPHNPVPHIPQIYKVVINKFDTDTLTYQLAHVRDLPVKLFFNCKNSKRKADTKGAHKRYPEDDIPKKGIQDEGGDFDLAQAAEEVCNREEIQFTGKENIEGFACLVNVFIRQLSVTFDNVALINVDNHEDDMGDGDQIKQGQLYYQSTVQFQDTFTTLVGKQLRQNRGSKISTINVKVNFKKLKNNHSYRRQQELCEKTFQYLGLKETLYIN
ncbi:hypothetical protein FGO68_gene5604 [Halteria grandinella]|uniref:Uncharacterized protein n=1 Tax=Halteria grandinella TaxID=5974 RepID=A0A8J8SXB3_HALGN|nr:hypothetical protein FGO68_gene5604 [Halteria grandinella]